jgi:hypothetical protein
MSTTTITRTTCKYPGCGQSAAPAAGTGRPPEYCAGRGHTRVSAWRERRRLTAEQSGTTISPAEDGTPLTTARMTGAELLRSLRAEADRITALGAGLRAQIGTLTDPTAAEAEVETVRAVAGQRAATAEARAAAAEQQAAAADRLRAEADAAAEEMSEHLTAAQTLAQAAELQRDEAVRQARAEADERVAVAIAERDAAIGQAAPTPGSGSAEPTRSGRKPSMRQPPPRPKPGRPSRRPPSPGLPPAPPRTKPSGSALTRRRCWTRYAPRRPVSVMSCAPTCVPAPNAPNSRLTPTATNSASSAPPAQKAALAAAQRQPRPRGVQPAARPPDTGHRCAQGQVSFGLATVHAADQPVGQLP